MVRAFLLSVALLAGPFALAQEFVVYSSFCESYEDYEECDDGYYVGPDGEAYDDQGNWVDRDYDSGGSGTGFDDSYDRGGEGGYLGLE